MHKALQGPAQPASCGFLPSPTGPQEKFSTVTLWLGHKYLGLPPKISLALFEQKANTNTESEENECPAWERALDREGSPVL